eukprot:NODE_41_length_34096_cov_2.002235.p20 type:complete len:242 gc:universal NODE_41_length_34096_cov_2.002235:27364-26639(-)
MDNLSLNKSLTKNEYADQCFDFSYGKMLKLKMAPNFLTELFLSNNDLREVPNELQNFKMLVRLDLSYNRLQKLENFIFQENLKDLNLNSNYLSSLTRDTKKSKLIRLCLFKNNFKSFSNDWISHNSLQELDLSENYITSLTAEFFLSLQKIKIFKISGNPIQYLPSSLNYLKQNLQELHCSNCQLKKIPSVLSFESLELLDISKNQIPKVTVSTKTLKWLSLNGNPVSIREVSDNIFLVID